MNRKLITSDNLNWPEIDEESSSKILSCLEVHLIKYPNIKRVKNPPKKQREKLKKKLDPISNDNEDNLKSIIIKSHFLFGINSITRYIESLDTKSKSILCVLVCRSCKPLRILTQHLMIMCSQKNIKAGCIYNLSSKISSLFNINRASAIAVLDSNDENVFSLLNDFKSNALFLLPDLVNPILKVNDEILNEDLVTVNIEAVEPDAKIKSLNDIFSFSTERDDKVEQKNTLDFMSFGDFVDNNDNNENILTNFNDKNFILFNDNVCMSVDAEDAGSLGRYFKNDNKNKKRSVEFKQFDISIKYANKEKSKQKNILKTKLASIKAKKQKIDKNEKKNK
jgi:hypothetical protein